MKQLTLVIGNKNYSSMKSELPFTRQLLLKRSAILPGWESAEHYPTKHWWSDDKAARAVARSISAEMHSGFQTLCQNMPMNCRARLPGKGMSPGVQADIDSAIWALPAMQEWATIAQTEMEAIADFER